MLKIQSVIVSTALAMGMAAPALAATTDPEVIIYRFPGVTDNGGGLNVGVATVFHCTNFSGATENVRFVTRTASGGITTNVVTAVDHLSTLSVATHLTRAYAGLGLGTGLVAQGTTAIAATSINIICTAETIDASTSVPNGVARRGIRFNPVPGSQE